jgi:hypothetical protein
MDAHVATITFCNERRFNAMSLSMWLKLGDLLESLNQDTQVRALVLRGTGERAFVSGADISEFGEQRNDPASVANYDPRSPERKVPWPSFPHPSLQPSAVFAMAVDWDWFWHVTCVMPQRQRNSECLLHAWGLGTLMPV